MTATPTIETDRLTLQAFGERHLTDRYVSWLNDTTTMRFSENRHRTHDVESCRRYWEGLCAADHFFWAVEKKSQGRDHIGNITAAMDRPNSVADVSILIGDRASRGHGYGREAWCAVVDHLIGQGGVRRVQAGTMAKNDAMLRLFNDAGMHVEGRQVGRFLLSGEPVDLVHACRVSPTWNDSDP